MRYLRSTFYCLSILTTACSIAACQGIDAPSDGSESSASNVVASNGNASRHQQYGEEILDKLNDRFYDAASGLYVEKIDANEAKAAGPSYLWPTAHMMRALTWGALVNPAKYNARLRSFVGSVERYRGKTVSGYTSGVGGGDRYYDDNAQLGNALTDVYQKVYPEQAILNQSIVAFRTCTDARDAHWGIPQLDSGAGKGVMFSMSVTPTALNASKLSEIGGAADYTSIASTYYSMFEDPTIKFKDPSTHLFGQGAELVNGAWKAIGGLRAYQTNYVVQLAIELYSTSHDAKYLNDARDMATAVLNRWYKPGKGFSEVAFWGGNDTIDMLIDLYEVDPDPKWSNAARDIVDFIIANGRDTRGYYPSGGGSRGAWNVVQTGIAPQAEGVAMMSQASAANAILRLAYCEAYTLGCAGPGSQAVASLYRNADYGGIVQSFGPGRYRLAAMGTIGNDAVSSLRVPATLKVTLYADDDFSGKSRVVTSDTSWIGADWNDLVSSLVVEPR